MSYDPSRPDVIADPYPAFRLLQAQDPAHWSGILRGWVVTRYADVKTALHDRRLSSDRITPFVAHESVRGCPHVQELGRIAGRWVVFNDPPAHTRLRGLINTVFTSRAVERLRPRIHEIVDELLAQVTDRGTMDVIGDFAYRLPVIVIAEMLGVPPEGREQMKAWSDELALFIGSALGTPDKYERAARGMADMCTYFREVVGARRRQPREDLISALVDAEQQGGQLSEEELVATCVLLLFAGHETTTNLIGNGLLSLLRHPDALAALRADPSLIGPAVEELLRYDGPTQAQVRVALDDIVLHGKTIRAGDRVFVMVNAANRDPARFDEPDRLDLTRADNAHVAFGYGAHFCVGAPLARLEGQVAIAAAVRRLPGLALAPGELTWLPSMVFRGVRSLPVMFRPFARTSRL
ncbi:MAG: hypothetical protein AUH30_16620 [Candidatus Rokubacteria bacterium 13_1_40CM_68_15]|nr:MAG: hypothetical protein AUH30_16620 [Candidatus Rokubacteria bacterium 13_1_40CM_68_15]